MIAWLHAAIVIFLIAVFPFVDRHFAKMATRLQMYAAAMIVSWCVTIVLVATIPFRQLWFAPPLPAHAPVWLIVEIVVVTLLIVLVSMKRGGQSRSIELMAPRSRTERIVFIFAALSAGVCEEIIYRGFMIRFFEQWSGLTAAVVLAAVAFALAHVYQGLQGALLTFFLALLFTFLFFLGGSLWLPMLFHAVGDLRLLAQPRANFPRDGG